MAFCTHCGAQLIPDAKFCPSCGASISALKKDNEPNTKKDVNYKETMHKRVSKSLKDNLKSTIEERSVETEAKKFVENKAKKIIEDDFSKANTNASKSTPKIADNSSNQTPRATATKNQKWILFYIIINILLILFNSGSDETSGILIFSVIVGVIYIFRRKKEKPFNIIAKIVLVLQAILAFSYIMQLFEFISVVTIIIVICLLLLIVVDIKLIISGNKKN